MLECRPGENCSALCRGAIQASFFTYLLFLFSTNISKYFGGQDLPDQYTARNITVTIRTAVGGLAYLATFIFGANALGLAGQFAALAVLHRSVVHCACTGCAFWYAALGMHFLLCCTAVLLERDCAMSGAVS